MPKIASEMINSGVLNKSLSSCRIIVPGIRGASAGALSKSNSLFTPSQIANSFEYAFRMGSWTSENVGRDVVGSVKLRESAARFAK